MANNKMTQRDYFNEIIALAKTNDRDDLVAFAEGRIEVLNRKSAKSSKPTATQVANEALKADILSGLSESEGKTVSDLIKSVDALADLSNQKVSAVLRLMIADGTVRKENDKKKTLFFKVVAE